MERIKQAAAILLIAGFLYSLPSLIQHQQQNEGRSIAAFRDQLQAIQNGQSTACVMPDFQLQPESLTKLKPVATKIAELNLSGDGLASNLEAMTSCTHLRILHLRTEVGDEEIAGLAQLRELEVLDLPLATGVTDAGLRSLEGHPTLKLVRLRAPKVTDAGLASFARIPALKWLHLMEVQLTDAGLNVFREMPKLESLYLDGDRATDDGLSALILARPDLHFHRDQVHLPSDPKLQDGHRD